METKTIVFCGKEIEVALWPQYNTMDVVFHPKINGSSADLSEAYDLSVTVSHAERKHKYLVIENIRIDRDSIAFTITGESQCMPGLYKVVISYRIPREGEPEGNLRTFGAYPFIIVPVGCNGNNESGCPDFDIPELEFTVDISLGTSGTNDHAQLINRDLVDQHPVGAISGLGEILDSHESEISGNTNDISQLQIDIQKKQALLIAGDNISITPNADGTATISSSGIDYYNKQEVDAKLALKADLGADGKLLLSQLPVDYTDIIWVNNRYTGDVENGTAQAPYKTITKAIQESPDDSDIVIVGGGYNEYLWNFHVAGKTKLRLYADSSSDLGIDEISWNSAESLEELVLCGLKGVYIMDLYLPNCSVRIEQCEIITCSISKSKDFTIDKCAFGFFGSGETIKGVINDTVYDSGGDPDADGTITTGKGNIEINRCSGFNLYHNEGNVIMRDTYLGKNPQGVSIMSVCTALRGSLFITGGSCQQSDGSYGLIQKTGDCPWGLGTFIHEEAQLQQAGNGTRYDSGLHGSQVYIHNQDIDGYVREDDRLVSHLKGISEAFKSGDSDKADLVNGVVPASQLPAYVDDVIEGTLISSTEFQDSDGNTVAPMSGKIYSDIVNNKCYRWGGSIYTTISDTLALGETASTAGRGDWTKAAYDHISNTNNPHNVTKGQIGLNNVDNTSDLNKPISNATQAALTPFQNHLTDYNNPHKTKPEVKLSASTAISQSITSVDTAISGITLTIPEAGDYRIGFGFTVAADNPLLASILNLRDATCYLTVRIKKGGVTIAEINKGIVRTGRNERVSDSFNLGGFAVNDVITISVLATIPVGGSLAIVSGTNIGLMFEKIKLI